VKFPQTTQSPRRKRFRRPHIRQSTGAEGLAERIAPAGSHPVRSAGDSSGTKILKDVFFVKQWSQKMYVFNRPGAKPDLFEGCRSKKAGATTNRHSFNMYLLVTLLALCATTPAGQQKSCYLLNSAPGMLK